MSGGRHIYFSWPGQQVKCSTGQIASGIDIKGDGGFVILPPSDHKSGNTYNWLIEQEPGECPIADAPAWLLERIAAGTDPNAEHLSAISVDAGDVIPEGHRNNTLIRLCGYLWQAGMNTTEIKAALLARNESRHRPPLDVKEVERTAESVSRYEPDSARQATIECWPERYLGDGGADSWPDPQPIPDDLPPVKSFDPVLLPSSLRPWIVDMADRMQCPLDFPAVTSMVALSGILGRKIAIRLKQRDNRTVYPNLWGVLIGRPSLMKSPPMKETLLPIRRMTADALAEHEAAIAEILAASDLQGIQTKVIRNNIAAASIPKRDERDRVVDLHALRHTFGTHLARAGVAPRVAMAAMRHSSLELTMNVYTDPTLLDVAGAVEALPAFGTAADEVTDQPLSFAD